MTSWWPIKTTLALVLALAACETADDRPASWHYLYSAIIEPSCATASCHAYATRVAGVDLSDAEGAYVILTGHVCGDEPLPQGAPRNYVTPGSSSTSTLIYQLRGTTPGGAKVRNVMPPDRPLATVEVDLIARWIDDGAACD